MTSTGVSCCQVPSIEIKEVGFGLDKIHITHGFSEERIFPPELFLEPSRIEVSGMWYVAGP
jgi:hypothetical protein